MDVQQVIRDAAARYGQDPAPWLKTAGIESANNPSNVNARSHAAGLFQFVPKTWQQYGNGGNPLDPAANADAAMRLARDNAAHFQSRMGRAPTPGETYLMHQQGAAGAERLLTNMEAPAASAVGAQAVLQNGGTADMTGGQFAHRWTSQFDALAPQPSFPPAPLPGGMPPGWLGKKIPVADDQPQSDGSALANAFSTAGKTMSDAIAAQGVQPAMRPPHSRFITA